MIARTAIARAAQALDAYDLAIEQGDRGGVESAAAEVGLWWTIAEAQGATTADVRAHRTSRAR
ncbi:hypothetical protein ACIQZO_26290 [Streptomyces sp. NPDC097617]|uniref:hypothetical protein n=1 Tax=Streptomyces sp. NPDC097617 TaxID=3366091 RepID=UPI0038158714